MNLKIMNYCYYDNKSNMEKYNAPVLIFFCRDKNYKFHIVYVCDKENLAPEMYVEKKEWGKFIGNNDLNDIGIITKWKYGPISNYGEETVVIYTTYPWQVKKLRKMFAHTYLSDIKWEKMCIEKMGLMTPYIKVPDDFNEKWLKVDDIEELPEEEHFYVPIRWVAWDIETNGEPVYPNFSGYKDAETCEIIAITAYDSYDKHYNRFYWHPKAKNGTRDSDWNRKGTYYVQSLNKEKEYDKTNKVTTHAFTNEVDMLKSYFNWFSTVRPDAQMGFNCYSKDTEILTNNGWKLFKDLTMKDDVATLNNKEIIFEKPINIFEYDYNGEMIKIEHNSTKLLITPNHKLYGAKSKTNKLYEAKEAMKFPNLSIPNKYNWKGTEKEWFYPPKIEYSKYNSNGNEINKIKMDDWLEFLGWYISEGWCSNDNYSINRGYYRIGISQTKKENRKEIVNLLKRIGIKPNISNKNQITFSNKQLWINLSKLGKAHEKYIPQEFINLSKRQLKILFETMMKGDGTNYKGKKTYYTTSKKLADQVQEIVLKLGYNSSLHLKKRENKNWHDYYHVNIRKTKFNYLKPKHYSIESYKGKVYCCEVSSHILIVRKDGYPIACGNSEGGYKISTQKGYSRKYWFDGYDMLYLYHRCKTLGLLDDIQKMSPLPRKGVKWRASGDKHSVSIEGVCQIDFIYTNEIFGYHKKFDKFREGNLNGYMSFFLGFGKLDHSEEQIWEMWKNDTKSDYDPSGPDNGVKEQRNLIKELFNNARKIEEAKNGMSNV